MQAESSRFALLLFDQECQIVIPPRSPANVPEQIRTLSDGILHQFDFCLLRQLMWWAKSDAPCWDRVNLSAKIWGCHGIPGDNNEVTYHKWPVYSSSALFFLDLAGRIWSKLFSGFIQRWCNLLLISCYYHKHEKSFAMQCIKWR